MGPTKISMLCFFYLLMFYFLSAGKGCDDAMVAKEQCSSPATPPAHFVLVHGYTSGAWSWYKMKALMETSGYKVTCIDLKGAGIDPTESEKVRTFTSYNEPLVKFMRNLSRHEKVILVGTSAGGVSVTDISHRFHEKIEVAVYLAATMLKHGFMTNQDILDGAPASVRGEASDTKHRQRSCPCKVPFLASSWDISLSNLLSRPVPKEAVLSAKFKGDAADKVRRVYIKTLCDKVLLPEQQAAMIKRWPPAEVIELQADHAVATSDPLVIFGLLYKIVASLEK